jgi:hypothetical protein
MLAFLANSWIDSRHKRPGVRLSLAADGRGSSGQKEPQDNDMAVTRVQSIDAQEPGLYRRKRGNARSLTHSPTCSFQNTQSVVDHAHEAIPSSSTDPIPTGAASSPPESPRTASHINNRHIITHLGTSFPLSGPRFRYMRVRRNSTSLQPGILRDATAPAPGGGANQMRNRIIHGALPPRAS